MKRSRSSKVTCVWVKDELVSGMKPKPYPLPIGGKDDPMTEAQFGLWYSSYPRKVAKVVARKAFIALKKSGADLVALRRATKAYADECKVRRTEPLFIMHPATFLRNERWRDYHADDAKSPAAISAAEIENIRAKHASGEYSDELIRKVKKRSGGEILTCPKLRT